MKINLRIHLSCALLVSCAMTGCSQNRGFENRGLMADRSMAPASKSGAQPMSPSYASNPSGPKTGLDLAGKPMNANGTSPASSGQIGTANYTKPNAGIPAFNNPAAAGSSSTPGSGPSLGNESQPAPIAPMDGPSRFTVPPTNNTSGSSITPQGATTPANRIPTLRNTDD